MKSLSDVARELEKELITLGCTINSPVSEPTMPRHIAHGGNHQQFNITCHEDQDFTDNSIKELAFFIHKLNPSVTFIELIPPKNSVEIACICYRGNLVFRYLEAYAPMSDKILKRIDVLMNKENDNGKSS